MRTSIATVKPTLSWCPIIAISFDSGALTPRSVQLSQSVPLTLTVFRRRWVFFRKLHRTNGRNGDYYYCRCCEVRKACSLGSALGGVGSICGSSPMTSFRLRRPDIRWVCGCYLALSPSVSRAGVVYQGAVSLTTASPQRIAPHIDPRTAEKRTDPRRSKLVSL